MIGSLIRLPIEITGQSDVDAYHSLAVRDLGRGYGVGLPSGKAVARPLTSEEVGLRAAGWADETPLWYYILRESDVLCAGERLGRIGGRIVAEVIITLLDRDLTSVRDAIPDTGRDAPWWACFKTMPSPGGHFTTRDFLGKAT